MPLWDAAFVEVAEGVGKGAVCGIVASVAAPLADVVVAEVKVLLLNFTIGTVVDFIAEVGVRIGASKGHRKLPI